MVSSVNEDQFEATRSEGEKRDTGSSQAGESSSKVGLLPSITPLLKSASLKTTPPYWDMDPSDEEERRMPVLVFSMEVHFQVEERLTTGDESMVVAYCD
jgi:hypothetical protein